MSERAVPTGFSRRLRSGYIISLKTSRVFLAAVLVFACFQTFINPPSVCSSSVIWQRVFGEGGADWFRSVAIIGNGDFLCVGAFDYKDDDSALTRGYIVRTDPTGVRLWEKKIGMQKKTVFESVLVTESSVIACGYTNAKGSGGFDVYLVKLDHSGNVLLEKTYGGPGDEKGIAISPALGGGFVIAGEGPAYPTTSDIDAQLLNVDEAGALRWQRVFGSDTGREGTQSAVSLDVLPDGYVLAGLTAQREYPAIRGYVVRTDASGNRIWEKDFGGQENAWASGVKATGDGFVLAGLSGPYGSMWGMDASGGIVWERRYHKGVFHSLEVVSGGDYLCVGYLSVEGVGSINAFAARIDPATHDPEWALSFGGTGTISSAYSVIENPTGGVVVAGVTNSTELGARGQDAYLAMLDCTSPTSPRISSISPDRGAAGSYVAIYGEGFGKYIPGFSWVSFGTKRAERYSSWEPVRIIARVPDLKPGTYDVAVTTPGGTSNVKAFRVIMPVPRVSLISPGEGNTGDIVTVRGSGFGGFDSRYSRVYFGNVKAVEYLAWAADKIVTRVPVLKPGTYGVSVRTQGGSSNSVPFKVPESKPPGPPVSGKSPRWYFAEGSTAWGFDTYITILNPCARPLKARLTFMKSPGKEVSLKIVLAPSSQTVINPRNHIGEADFSTLVECLEGKSICAERRMLWWGDGALSSEGHSAVGAPSPAARWYFAEGSSAWGFESWFLVFNPSGREANLTITYMVERGTAVKFVKKVGARSRATFSMFDDIGAADASVFMESDVPVVTERAMYRNRRRQGHCSLGAASASREVYLAEGSSGYGFTTYLLIQNPNRHPVEVNVELMTGSGPVGLPTLTMPPLSRKTVNINETISLPHPDFSSVLRCSSPITAERAMYWDNGTGEASHCSTGFPEPARVFYFPDGETSNGHETWTLVENPASEPVKVRVSYLGLEGKGNVSFEDVVPGRTRRTYSMASLVTAGRAGVVVECLTTGKKIFAERSIYWNSRGAGTCTVGGYEK